MGGAIQAVEIGWPMGLPLCRQMAPHKGLWEVREDLSDGRIGRVLFVVHKGHMALLHGFIKKSKKTPKNDLNTALKRQKGLK